MSTASPGWMPQLQRVVGRVFYHHGLFCANNPLFVLSVVVIVFLVSLAPLLSLSQVDQEVEPRAVRWAGPVVPEQADIQDHDGPLLAVQPITVSFPEAASANADVAKAVLLVLETLQKRIEAFTLQNEYVALLWLTHGCDATLLYLPAQTNFCFQDGHLVDWRFLLQGFYGLHPLSVSIANGILAGMFPFSHAVAHLPQ
jgi:hypothetical protein